MVYTKDQFFFLKSHNLSFIFPYLLLRKGREKKDRNYTISKDKQKKRIKNYTSSKDKQKEIAKNYIKSIALPQGRAYMS